MGKHGKSERIRYRGEAFRRYPESANENCALYFRSQNGRYLHRVVWETERGPIPDGWQIHHRDGDPGNNAIDNLECLPPSEHASEHFSEERAERARKHVDTIRHLAAAWHKGQAGREWHRRHATSAWRSVPFRECKCEQCGAAFKTRATHGNERFCGNNCKSKWRRLSGVDNVDRVCVCCGKPFTANKYSAKRNCSRECGGVMARRHG